MTCDNDKPASMLTEPKLNATGSGVRFDNNDGPQYLNMESPAPAVPNPDHRCSECSDRGVTQRKEDGENEATVCTKCKGAYRSGVADVALIFDPSAPRDAYGNRNPAHGITCAKFYGNRRNPPTFQ